MPKKIPGLGLVAITLVIFLVVVLQKKTSVPVNSPKLISNQNSIQTSPAPAKQSPATIPSSPSQNSSAQTNSVENTILSLQQIATRGDSQSFQEIMSELTNRNPEIRRAALDATIQFGSRDAIPVLKDLADKTDDAYEKVEILDAIKFLALPSFSEVNETRRNNPESNKTQVAPK